MISAFGVEVSKADTKTQRPTKTPTGRLVTGGLLPGYHGAVAGKKGHKLRAVGYEVVGSSLAGPPGAAVGTHLAHQAGHYKPHHTEVGKSAFSGVRRAARVASGVPEKVNSMSAHVTPAGKFETKEVTGHGGSWAVKPKLRTQTVTSSVDGTQAGSHVEPGGAHELTRKGKVAAGAAGAGVYGGAMAGASAYDKRTKKVVAKARTQDLPDNTSPTPMATSRAIRKPTPPKLGVQLSRVDPNVTATVPTTKLTKSAGGHTMAQSAFGVDHGDIAKAHSDNYKALVWNKDAIGGPNAKGNRKILRRSTLKGMAQGVPLGAGAGAGAGALMGGKTGAKVGAVVGGLVGQQAGGVHGAKRGMKNPNYKAKP